MFSSGWIRWSILAFIKELVVTLFLSLFSPSFFYLYLQSKFVPFIACCVGFFENFLLGSSKGKFKGIIYHCAESEDSDAEGGLGNVNKMIIRPPGHSGKAKKGHICFDASFETGNLGRVDLISEFEYDLFIRPDTCNPRLRLWFNFTVDNVKADQRVIFNIVNISKSANLFRNGMTPLVKSSSRSKWQRIPRDHVSHRGGAKRKNTYTNYFEKV